MTNNPKEHSIAIVDDHLLFAGSLEKLIDTFLGFNVLYHAKNGLDLQRKIKSHKIIPEIILLDINMPVMNGFETAEWLTEHYPDIKILALSMDDDENTILKMLRKGVKGYLLKDIHPDKLEEALSEVIDKGYYHSERVATTLLHSLQPGHHDELVFKENEITFLQLACSEMTYKEIAGVMNLSPKTIDGYRQELFNRLNIKNRVGLVIFALKNNIISI
jgi:DNA-binding NarL/FixJ family response regulator